MFSKLKLSDRLPPFKKPKFFHGRVIKTNKKLKTLRKFPGLHCRYSRYITTLVLMRRLWRPFQFPVWTLLPVQTCLLPRLSVDSGTYYADTPSGGGSIRNPSQYRNVTDRQTQDDGIYRA